MKQRSASPAAGLRAVGERRARGDRSASDLLRDRLFSGDREGLLACAPDLVCLALLPYLEFSQMADWAESATPASVGAPA